MKRAILLGCTGSIGTTAITAIRDKNLDIQVVALSAHTNAPKLFSLAESLSVEAVCLTGGNCPPSSHFKTYSHTEGLKQMLRTFEADIILNAIAGFDGLEATIACIECGRDVALANKESVVCGGSFLFDLAKQHGVNIIPVDSEHSALYELMKHRSKDDIESLIITASGGPFRDLPYDEFDTITVEQALRHPTWNMGRKITIDSATLANKALEVIEASYLFGFPSEKIEVVIHPQSIVHSMVRLKDGAVYAQLGTPDMTLPIVNALIDGSERLVKPLSFSHLQLTFDEPDFKRFPLLSEAFSILKRRGSTPIAFNAADEVAVHAFLNKQCSYAKMVSCVLKTMDNDWDLHVSNFAETVEIDRKARALARSFL
ncbi:1-deoxy-D-xylulose 5-phosphate reductoisomerase [Sphaerochaeta pleomorpha str. Grapes]|uniref:1-deoxy-D-xylulose 5-phosphate reductoisomerase n=1 Tax=Sphaerochaeta pleomorpha (strain ATCC BAA-1885 / DSM 22778 / Grapes) TaxID=158190 RepID=G8QXY5_SPHPG|nr:1-deoxy-D-xylulose-5-phosphate reductoisomerase [Sphaerochaeta pleomorpha]AEV28490.1 1-deoxy-D-xylulose 5-phosphate reductoisomerase [Sphaerochaeta pleomorpha str. Grapes]